MKRALPLLLGLALALPASANDNLDRCRESEAEFDYQGVLAECTLAVSEELSDAERIEAYKLLGFANTAIGKARPGREWFQRLLALDPGYELGPEISPRFRKNFEQAKQDFEKDAKISLSHTPAEAPKRYKASADPLALRFEAVDKMKLIAEARVVASATWEGLEAPVEEEAGLSVERKGDRAILTGPLPDPGRGAEVIPQQYELTYRLRLLNSAGKDIEAAEGFESVSLAMVGPEPSEPLDLTWILIGGGSALVVGTAVIGTVLVCGSGVCNPRFQTPPVGGVAVGIAR